MQVNILEAKNRLSQLVKSAQSGEEVIIANRGVPVARLIPAMEITASPARARIAPGGVLQWLEQHPLPAHARRSHKQIEAGLKEERSAWG